MKIWNNDRAMVANANRKMKKILVLLFIGTMIGCDCIGQIPPQVAYVDSNCVAIMPDVISNVIIDDNCGIVTAIQIPIPGAFINPPIDGRIVATDESGNITTAFFHVVKMDTISPTITWDEHAPTALKEGFDEASEHYTHFIQWIKYDTNRIFYIPEFQVYRPDSTDSMVWYNSIVLN